MTALQSAFKRKLTGFGMILMFAVFAVMCFSVYKAVAHPRMVQESLETANPQSAPAKATDPGVVKFAFLAAAIAVALGSIGAGLAVGYVGAAAMGAIGEKPELAGRALIFVGLAEGIAIYGLIISIMILGKV